MFKKSKRRISKLPSSNKPCKEGKYLPVSRYEDLYHGKSEIKQEFCGTFYFFEPESEMLLNMGKTLIAGNKVDALLKLQPNIPINKSFAFNAYLDIVNNIYQQGYYIDNNIIHNFPQDIVDKKLFRQEVESVFGLVTKNSRNEKDIEVVYVDNKIYNNFYEEIRVKDDKLEEIYWGNRFTEAWDYLDQIICQEARKQGYDTIILQREAGENRINTEILDTRRRQESYQNLCSRKVDFPSSDKYPTIWFTDFSFINIKSNK